MMIGLEFLQKIGEILQKSLSSEETYSAVFDILDGIIEFDSATLFVYQPANDALEVAENRGPQVVDLVSDVAFSRGGGLSGWVASQREPIILATMGSARNSRGFRSLISVPLWSGDKLEGVLHLGHNKPGFYQTVNRTDLERLGLQLSLIVEQLQLRTQLQEKNQLLEKTLQELRTAQDALVEKERLAAIGQLVVRLNHEINNPLSIIISFIDLLTARCEKDLPEVIETLAKMRAAACRINEVTRKLEDLQTTEAEEYLEGVKMLKIE
ncbi:MAG: GAF domain-containing protein [Candidatus Neomarinimicrobiota bacterium]